MRALEYFSPATLPDALNLLSTHCDQGKILAGGTDLLVQMKAHEIQPKYVIDLKKIRTLHGIEHLQGGGVDILPLTTVAEMTSADSLNGALAILREAALTVGSVQIRNRATIGGNVCRAAPSADLVPALLVLNTQVKIVDAARERWVPIADFFVGPGRTELKSNEILAAIHVPPPPCEGIGVYLKLGPRETMDLATAGVAVFLLMDGETAICRDIRIALASVAPKAVRAYEAEKFLTNKQLSQAIVSQGAGKASEESRPITDVYGSDWYKREMVEVLVKRAILEAVRRIRGKS